MSKHREKKTLDVCLIQPPVNLQIKRSCLSDKSYSIGLLSLIAVLKQEGFSTEGYHIPNLLDQGESLEKIIATIVDKKPSTIGISLNWLHFSRGALQIARLFSHRLPQSQIVLGGRHATLFFKEILLNYGDFVDVICLGEAENSLPALCRGKEIQKDKIAGIAWRTKAGDIRFTSPQPPEHPEKFPNYSYQDFHPFPSRKETDVFTMGALSTCRGPCIKNCRHCLEGSDNVKSTGRSKPCPLPPGWVVSQMEKLIKEGLKNITIQDPLFTLGEAHLLKLINMIRESELSIGLLHLFCIPGVNYSSVFKALSDCPFEVELGIGIESGVAQSLAILGRDPRQQTILDTIEEASSYGLIVSTWWMTGLPGETRKNISDTCDLLEKTVELGAIPQWVTPLILFPGTILYQHAQEYGIRPLFRSFEDFSKFSEEEVNPLGIYPELITHTTESLTRVDILKNTFRLKELARSRLEKLQNIHRKRYGRHLDIENIRKMQTLSLF